MKKENDLKNLQIASLRKVCKGEGRLSTQPNEADKNGILKKNVDSSHVNITCSEVQT